MVYYFDRIISIIIGAWLLHVYSFVVLGGSLTKIAYYSTVSFRRVNFTTDNIDTNNSKNKDNVRYSLRVNNHFGRLFN